MCRAMRSLLSEFLNVYPGRHAWEFEWNPRSEAPANSIPAGKLFWDFQKWGEEEKKNSAFDCKKRRERRRSCKSLWENAASPASLQLSWMCFFFLRRIRLDCLFLRCLSQCCRKRGQNVELERRNLRWSDNGINNQKWSNFRLFCPSKKGHDVKYDNFFLQRLISFQYFCL